jgi:hypothetical protein
MIYKITKELDTTNQRLNDLKDIPTGNIEEKLTKRVELFVYNYFNFFSLLFLVRRKISDYDPSTISLAGT